ncbi:hypothetical protein NST62_06565 [Ureibacillus sp. FSL K6-8385]|uniref:Uncharacterized protein n=1 Tax=Ureibacillus terrenus TaxID=118246 RepID=A0A540V164_9BACL|nr:hypothetical protein [Ureibacillus terrenus]MED3662606.1 hypothetical protein [Ureibacillus terrenus]MED3765104.1 hypothetical protein [Ureibacillus terrenus]TQE90478.1 hypothetical protein FKZ59_09380 [Ureibacillus terrenus]
MKVYSLSGPSGSGKSTTALQFAHDHQIEAIIDDGLLIKNGQKIAGTSAKFEKNTIRAVRRAIFQDEAHRKEVKEAIKKHHIQSVLIIGTSDKMTKKIAEQLELGPIERFYYIDDIRSKNEIKLSQFIRTTQGKHLMPIPYRQVEQNFFKRLIQKGFDIFSKNRVKLGETTIVQPDFHRQTIDILPNVYVDLIKYAISRNPHVAKVEFLHFSMKKLYPRIYVSLHIKAPVRYDAVAAMEELQKQIAFEFQRHFEFEPMDIHIFIKGMI